MLYKAIELQCSAMLSNAQQFSNFEMTQQLWEMAEAKQQKKYLWQVPCDSYSLVSWANIEFLMIFHSSVFQKFKGLFVYIWQTCLHNWFCFNDNSQYIILDRHVCRSTRASIYHKKLTSPNQQRLLMNLLHILGSTPDAQGPWGTLGHLQDQIKLVKWKS